MAAISLNDTNLFAYCGNNPVVYGDKNGELATLLLMMAVGAVVGGIAAAVEAKVQNKPLTPENLIGGIIIGAVTTLPGCKFIGVAYVAVSAMGNAIEAGMSKSDAIIYTITTCTVSALPIPNDLLIVEHTLTVMSAVGMTEEAVNYNKTSNDNWAKSAYYKYRAIRVSKFVNGELVHYYRYIPISSNELEKNKV